MSLIDWPSIYINYFIKNSKQYKFKILLIFLLKKEEVYLKLNQIQSADPNPIRRFGWVPGQEKPVKALNGRCPHPHRIGVCQSPTIEKRFLATPFSQSFFNLGERELSPSLHLPTLLSSLTASWIHSLNPNPIISLISPSIAVTLCCKLALRRAIAASRSQSDFWCKDWFQYVEWVEFMLVISFLHGWESGGLI